MVMIRSGDRRVSAAWKPTDLIKTQSMIWLPWILAENGAPLEGNGNTTFDYNNIYYAQHGYAVLNYTARGWGRSCGSAESREGTARCSEGWIRLADQRYEARDTQYLFGVLADQGIVKPTKIGTTGISYGGGQSIELAYLKNRIRKPNGEFAPWTSPKGKKMTIAAAANAGIGTAFTINKACRRGTSAPGIYPRTSPPFHPVASHMRIFMSASR